MSSKAKIPVTVVIPVRNEERNLPKCLAGLSRFAEVIVADSGSSDHTQEIARQAGARVIEFRWNGQYPKKRNWVLLNEKLENEWVLFLDADEFVDDRFCDELKTAISSGDHAGYWLTYANHFRGRRLKYGVPQRKLALFKVKSGLYERIEEDMWSDLDMEVHEHPVITGTIGSIRSPIEHNDGSGLSAFIERHRKYAMWEARRALKVESAKDEVWNSFTFRQRMKYRNLASWWFPWCYFFYTYVVRLGFLDGGAGFSYAFYKLWYFETVRQLSLEGRSNVAE
ncbi:MAG: glycosyltransferase family 2 protein [Rhizobiales bacterium]|nr:glycosyltransferase family 2 protein [Hyphomicrobiales bacterium]